MPGDERFVVFQVDAHVADMGDGEQHPLPAVGRIGEDFLVTGHAGVENQLKNRVGLRAKSFSGQDGTIFKG